MFVCVSNAAPQPCDLQLRASRLCSLLGSRAPDLGMLCVTFPDSVARLVWRTAWWPPAPYDGVAWGTVPVAAHNQAFVYDNCIRASAVSHQNIIVASVSQMYMDTYVCVAITYVQTELQSEGDE